MGLPSGTLEHRAWHMLLRHQQTVSGWIAAACPSSRPEPVDANHDRVVGAGAAPAYANYSHYSNHASGFGQLRVETNAAYSNEVQMQVYTQQAEKDSFSTPVVHLWSRPMLKAS